MANPGTISNTKAVDVIIQAVAPESISGDSAALATKTATVITDDTLRSYDPVWSMDNTLIAYLAAVPTATIMTSAPDGTGMTQLEGHLRPVYLLQWQP